MNIKSAVLAALSLAAAAAAFFWWDGGNKLKAKGVLAYTPQEAQELAYRKCGQCHSTDKVVKYCMRCGPPIVVVVHNMRKLTALEIERGRTDLESYTDAQAVAIAQAWNALVGNWEDMWRKQDLVKLLEGDKALIELVDTPVKERPIETALTGQSAPGAYKEVR